jgi:uncharacterized protein
MAEHPNIALHKKGHEAFNRGDMDGVRDFFAEDTVRHVPGRSQLAGVHRGRDAVLQQFARMAELTDRNMKLEPLAYLANDTKTVAIFRFTATRGGRQSDVRVCEVSEWRDGKSIEQWLSFDDQYALDDFWS